MAPDERVSRAPPNRLIGRRAGVIISWTVGVSASATGNSPEERIRALHAARIGHRAAREISRRTRKDWAWGCRFGEQRRIEPADRGARRDAAGPAEDGPACARRPQPCCLPLT